MEKRRVWTVLRKREQVPTGSSYALLEALLKEYCKEQGYEVVGHSDLVGDFKSVGKELETIAVEQDIDVIVVTARKQISRDPAELISAIRALEPHEVYFEFIAAPHYVTEMDIVAEEVYKELKGYKTPWGTVL